MAYIALIKASAVRDTQYAKTVDPEPCDDSAWTDMPDAEIFIGVYKHMSQEETIAQAAKYAETDPENIRLITTGAT